MDCSTCSIAAWAFIVLIFVMCTAVGAMFSDVFSKKVPMWVGVLISIVGIIAFFAMRLGLDYCPEACFR